VLHHELPRCLWFTLHSRWTKNHRIKFIDQKNVLVLSQLDHLSIFFSKNTQKRYLCQTRLSFHWCILTDEPQWRGLSTIMSSFPVTYVTSVNTGVELRPTSSSQVPTCSLTLLYSTLDPQLNFFTAIRPASGIFRLIFGWPNIVVEDLYPTCFWRIFGCVCSWNSSSNLALLWLFCCMLYMTSVSEMTIFHLVFILTWVW